MIVFDDTNLMTATGCSDSAADSTDRFLLWIDGVGCYLLLDRRSVTLGGPTAVATDISLLANLSRRHAEIVRDDSGHVLVAHGTVHVDDRLVADRINLSHGNTIRLGASVELVFGRPTALSATASLEFASDHRPALSVDGLVLVEQTCLLGPGADCHVHCPEWPDTVLLIRRDRQWFTRSVLPLEIDGRPARGETPLDDGGTVTGETFRFRIESWTPDTC